jgi:hypothetical protein
LIGTPFYAAENAKAAEQCLLRDLGALGGLLLPTGRRSKNSSKKLIAT